MSFADDKPRWQGWKIDIVGTDVSRSGDRAARAGIYSQFEVQRGLPVIQMIRWFDEIGRQRLAGLAEAARHASASQPHSLIEPPPRPGRFDIILCRNVLLYFSPEHAADRCSTGSPRRARRTATLMLGAGETVIGQTERLRLRSRVSRPLSSRAGRRAEDRAPRLTGDAPPMGLTRARVLARKEAMSDIIDCPSPNFDERDLPVSMLVLHYTGMERRAVGDRAAARSRGARFPAIISSPRTARSCAWCAEDKRAWHAGRSYWRGVTDVNAASIGIEIVNPGHEFGYRPFREEQMDALVPLRRRHRRAPQHRARQRRRPFRHRARRASRIPANCSTGRGSPSSGSRCRARPATWSIRSGPTAASCSRSSASAMTCATKERRWSPSSAASAPN